MSIMIGNQIVQQPPARQSWWRTITVLAIGAVLYGGVDFALPHIFGTPQPVHHAGPEQSTEDHAQPKVSPADVESDLIKQLNRSRLAGRWVRHDDGSYRWNSYAVTLRLPVAGGELVNAADSVWTMAQ